MQCKLTLENISKSYDCRWIIKNLSLEVGKGECLLITGDNGAGKTTLLNLIAGLIRPDKGEIHLEGNIGALFHQTWTYPHLTGREYLELVAALYRRDLATHKDLFRKVGLHDSEDALISTYSRGMKQRIALARLHVQSPDLFLLDEPSTGLDKKGLQLLLNQLKENLDSGASVLIATHRPELFSSITTRRLHLEEDKPEEDAPPIITPADHDREGLRL